MAAARLGIAIGTLLAGLVLPAWGGEPVETKGSSKTEERPPEFKVVFWFDGQRFRSQPYDVRKGQYTKAVQDWVDDQPADASGYIHIGRLATVRNVYLDREKGTTEKEKLDGAIARELGKIEGFDPRQLRWNAPAARATCTPQPKRSPSRRPSLVPVPSGPTYGFPQPVPYPRPHP